MLKRSCFCHSLSRFVKVLPLAAAAFCTALPASAAAEKADPVMESNAKVDSLIDPLIARAITQKKKKDFRGALQTCREAEKKLAALNLRNPQYLTAKRSMLSSLKNEICAEEGQYYLTQANQAYENALGQSSSRKMRSSLQEALRLSKEAAKADPALTFAAEDLKKACESLAKIDAKGRAEAQKRYETVKKEVTPLIRNAESKLQKRQYKAADTFCDDAIRRIDSGRKSMGVAASEPKVLEAIKSSVRQLKTRIHKEWYSSYIATLRAQYMEAYNQSKQDRTKSNQDIQSAFSNFQRLRKELPEYANTSDVKLLEDDFRALQKSNQFAAATQLQEVDPANTSRKARIYQLLREGELYYKNASYEKSRNSLEQVLVLDPYNTKAAYMLNRVYRKISRIADLRAENDLLERINEVEWKWSSAILPQTDRDLDTGGPQRADSEGKSNMYRKLQTIIIPNINFSDVEITSAIKELGMRSKELDPEKKGVDFIYQPDPSDAGKEISISFTNMPIGDVIRYLCQSAHLKYKVDDNAVRISSSLSEMDFRNFRMSSALYNHICESIAGKSANSADSSKGGKGGKKSSSSGSGDFGNVFSKSPDNAFGGGEGGGGGGTETDSESLPEATSQDLMSFFKGLGVQFEKNSAITYDRRSGKLIVKNTPDNLQRLERILREVDIPVPMVLIEAKIIEITVTDLEELGFDWTLTHNNTDAEWMPGFTSKTGDNSGVAEATFGTAYLVQTLTRHYGGSIQDFSTVDATKTQSALINNLNILPNFGPDSAYNISLTVNAIDQSGRGEILSAPKIIALNGKTANIELAQKMYFPEEWDDPEVTMENNTYEYTPPIPDFGDARPIGVTFSVKPDVSPNNHTIALNMKPQITELTNWTSYDYNIVIGSLKSPINEYSPKIKMPEISVREIDTNVKVYDGETIILGGILQDENSRRDDRYPIVGEVPLVGRLFSSQAESTTKTNMLIFVTTRIMSVDGMPVNPRKDSGMFDFKR